jgi:FtsH-binding integral membrane protein
MNPKVLPVLMFVLSFVSFATSLFLTFTFERFKSSPLLGIAFLFIGLMGSYAASALRYQNRKLAELEKLVGDLRKST